MELLVTLRNQKLLSKIVNCAQGIIVGSFFSLSYSYTLDELENINNYCKKNRLKIYITIDAFISEDDKPDLYRYMDFLKSLDVDGIYFHDLGIFDIAKEYGLTSKLIYDGQTIICNSLDVAFYKSQGIDGVVLSRELTLEELDGIVINNPDICDVLIFGHTRLSYSKRKFLTNYLKEIDKEYDFLNSETMRLVEEKRDYQLPIIEDESGTKIYTDYIFQMYNEISNLKPFIKRGIIDTLFIDDEVISVVLRDYKRITNENSSFLLENLVTKYPNKYSTGYLYQKTNITKDEKD